MRYKVSRTALALGLMVVLLSSACSKAVTTDSLLDEMVDLRRLTKLPDPAYTRRRRR